MTSPGPVGTGTGLTEDEEKPEDTPDDTNDTDDSEDTRGEGLGDGLLGTTLDGNAELTCTEEAREEGNGLLAPGELGPALDGNGLGGLLNADDTTPLENRLDGLDSAGDERPDTRLDGDDGAKDDRPALEGTRLDGLGTADDGCGLEGARLDGASEDELTTPPAPAYHHQNSVPPVMKSPSCDNFHPPGANG